MCQAESGCRQGPFLQELPAFLQESGTCFMLQTTSPCFVYIWTSAFSCSCLSLNLIGVSWSSSPSSRKVSGWCFGRRMLLSRLWGSGIMCCFSSSGEDSGPVWVSVEEAVKAVSRLSCQYGQQGGWQHLVLPSHQNDPHILSILLSRARCKGWDKKWVG